jgi:hypothetical protein
MKLFSPPRHGEPASLFFKNRETPIFENLSACGTQGNPIREATDWFFFGGISRQRKN